MRPAFLLFLLLTTLGVHAQTIRLSGTITNSRLEPLAFASLQVKELGWGVTTKEDGTYTLQLEQGTYTLVVSMIGYQTRSLTLTLEYTTQQSLILEEAEAALDDIVIRVKARDRAEELVRQVIRGKEALLEAPGAYSVQAYIKATGLDSTAGQTTDTSIDATLARRSLSELLLRIDRSPDGRLRESRLGVQHKGATDGLFYRSATEGDFNFLHNLVRIPSLSAATFLSPFSYSGLLAYKFKTVRTEKRNGQKWYTISVRPRQLSNATVEGEVLISDSAFTLHSVRFRFPSYHLSTYDQFEVAQWYDKADGAWMVTRQQFTYSARAGRQLRSGQTEVTYTEYRLRQSFPRNHFGPEVSATADKAYEQDSTFWGQVRSQPLGSEEVRLIRYRDSVHRATHTTAYLDSIDRLTNRITWKKVLLTGQQFYDRGEDRTWILPPVLTVYNPLQFGGGRIQPSFYYSRRPPSRKTVVLDGGLSYGLRNRDLNANFRLYRLYDPFRRGFYRLDLNRDFARLYEGDAWINQVKRSSYFLNNYVALVHGVELVNGLQLYTSAGLSLRRSVADYKTNPKVDSLLGDILQDNEAVPFEAYNGVYTEVRLQYTPAQRYLREPREKVILGSRWPTFFVSWQKGVRGALHSEADFDYGEGGVEQQVSAGVLGMTRYQLKGGSFFNRRRLHLPDYRYQRRGDPLLFMNPDESFQALDSTFAVFGPFYQGHLVHEFNGALLNRIPLLKKLQLREVAGAGFLSVPERKLRYAELFAGVERVFRLPFQLGDPMDKYKAGVYVVASLTNGAFNPVQVKVGLTKWDRRRNRWR